VFCVTVIFAIARPHSAVHARYWKLATFSSVRPYDCQLPKTDKKSIVY